MNIGLTGGIACGKSTVSAMLVRRGAILIDADRIAREVVEPGSPVLAQVAAHFGQDMLLPDGSLHRKRLGETVFGNEEARKALEDLLHPSIRALMKERMAAAERDFPDKLVVVDVPLLYESGLQSMFSSVMVVYVPRETQLRRLMERDGLNAEQAESRLAAQWPIERKKELADICIDNSGTLEQTERLVELFWLQRGL
ncbi:dephospho-CoA kinase [Paenibacillus chitinolyticus]|uniref:dephospho-CoA kinase n=1 Tax=Paenibacillus chitinolyticus TaxID=79263 RepID=UPI002DBB6D6C|nr:dephospho-CoA kinase [Paenibacillus chitinolyticus]MEC0248992.1 dephospho-CoA kinase [Paenibacillus chitinolyticus]